MSPTVAWQVQGLLVQSHADLAGDSMHHYQTDRIRLVTLCVVPLATAVPLSLHRYLAEPGMMQVPRDLADAVPAVARSAATARGHSRCCLADRD